MSNIFSGEESRELWDEINSIDAMSTGDDIGGVLYSLGCALQKLETKINRNTYPADVVELANNILKLLNEDMRFKIGMTNAEIEAFELASMIIEGKDNER